jgi:hypothetical protein
VKLIGRLLVRRIGEIGRLAVPCFPVSGNWCKHSVDFPDFLMTSQERRFSKSLVGEMIHLKQGMLLKKLLHVVIILAGCQMRGKMKC